MLIFQHISRPTLIVQNGSCFGEISPLPGWSQESFQEAKEDLLSGAYQCPSVRFGLLCAKTPLHSLSVPLACLTPRSGFSTLKLKLGHLSCEEALYTVKQHRDFRLRLDFNRKWSLNQALEFASHFKPNDFDYLEEPVSSFEDLITFSKKTALPIALDESLQNNWDLIPTLKAIVVKPTVVGCIPKVPPHLDLILSSSHETGIGLLHIAKLAQDLQLKKPVGLDTPLQDDLLLNPIVRQNGFFSWKFSTPLIDTSKLCAL